MCTSALWRRGRLLGVALGARQGIDVRLQAVHREPSALAVQDVQPHSCSAAFHARSIEGGMWLLSQAKGRFTEQHES